MTALPAPHRRLLLVAYYFPPLGGAGSMRAASFARELAHHGWDVTVLAPRGGAFHRDPALAFPEEQVVRTAPFDLSRAGKRALRTGGDEVRPASVSGIRYSIRGAVHAHAYFPDPQVGWAMPALAAGLALARRERFDVVLSTAWPMTAHLIGRRIARSAGTPWVADFRDPWAERMQPGTVKARRAARLERRIVRDASAVTMASPSWARRHADRWEREVDVVLNGHDVPAGAARRTPEPGLVAYLGTYYPGEQDLGSAWAAIAHDPDLQLEIIGVMTDALTAELTTHGLQGRVRVTGFLSHPAAVTRIMAADVLLLAGPGVGSTSFGGQIPAKVFEYLVSDRPIVYVGDPESDVAEILRGWPGCFMVSTGDVEGAAAALAAARGTRHVRHVSALSRSAQGRRLARILDRVVASTD